MKRWLWASFGLATSWLWLQPAAAQGPAAAPSSTPATPATPSITLHSEVANQSVFSFDFGVPTSPSLALAGLSTDKATVNSSSLKPFVFSLPSVLSGAGGQSAALDFAPAALFQGPGHQSYSAYITPKNWGLRLAFRSRFNTAVYNGVDGNGDASKGKPSKIAVGASMSLLDNSDPLMATTMASRASGKTAWMSCLDTLGPEVQEVGKVVTPQTADLAILLPLQAEVQYGWKAEHPELLATPDLARRIAQSLDKSVSFDGLSKYELTAKLREYSDALEQKVEAAQKGSATALASNVDVVALKNAAKTCADKANNAALYAPALNIGFGRLYRGDPGHLSNFSEGGDVLWMSGRYPITEVQMGGGKVSGYLMLAAYARVSSGEFVATGNKTTPQIKADVQDYWGGLEYYSLTAKLAAQYGWTDTKATDSAQSALSRSGNRYLISAARPLGDKNAGLWVGVSYGTARGTIDTLKGKVFLITLDFAPPKPADILGLAKH